MDADFIDLFTLCMMAMAVLVTAWYGTLAVSSMRADRRVRRLEESGQRAHWLEPWPRDRN